MKKLLFALPIVLLLAAGCNSNQPAVENQPNNTQSTTQVPPTPTQTAPSIPANWKTYINSEYGFQFQYPAEWQMTPASSAASKTGLVVSFQTPDTNTLIQQHKLDPGYSQELTVSYWNNINNEYAKGGSYLNEPTYKNLADFMNAQNTTTRKVLEITVNGQTAYKVTIGGAGSNDGMMIEYNGIYQLSFERTNQGKDETGKPDNTADLIISTFKFTK